LAFRQHHDASEVGRTAVDDGLRRLPVDNRNRARVRKWFGFLPLAAARRDGGTHRRWLVVRRPCGSAAEGAQAALRPLSRGAVAHHRRRISGHGVRAQGWQHRFLCRSPRGRLPPQFAQEKLFDGTRVVVGRKGHPLAGARSLRQLVGAKWATSSITFKAEEEFRELFAQYGLPAPQLALRAQSCILPDYRPRQHRFSRDVAGPILDGGREPEPAEPLPSAGVVTVS
jgi:hypothetical protein